MKILNTIKNFVANVTNLLSVHEEIEQLKLCNAALEEAIMIDRQIIGQLIHNHNALMSSVKTSSTSLDVSEKINSDEKWKVN